MRILSTFIVKSRSCQHIYETLYFDQVQTVYWELWYHTINTHIYVYVEFLGYINTYYSIININSIATVDDVDESTDVPSYECHVVYGAPTDGRLYKDIATKGKYN